jgi:hypothetical protein
MLNRIVKQSALINFGSMENEWARASKYRAMISKPRISSSVPRKRTVHKPKRIETPNYTSFGAGGLNTSS